MISAFILRAADLSCFHGTPHNLEVFRDACLRRKSLIEQVSCARGVEKGGSEIWKRAEGCMDACDWLMIVKGSILQFHDGLLQ